MIPKFAQRRRKRVRISESLHWLEMLFRKAYSVCMDEHTNLIPADWLAVLDESDADMAAGRIVSGESVIRDLYASLARLEAAAEADMQPSAPASR
jgi:hypothetical protein